MNIATAATIATTIITTMIAALIAVITWRQWITNRARLRHELFDRRYTIFEQIAAFVAKVLQMGSVEPGEAFTFLRLTKQAYFAFGCDDEVGQLVGDIYKQAVLLYMLKEKQQVLSGDAMNANIDKQGEVLKWFDTTLGSLEQRFEKYLRLDH